MGAHIIEHLPADDVEALLHHTASVTRRGGYAIFVTPDPRDFRVISEWFWNDPTHVRPYTAGAVRQLIDPAEWRLGR